MAERDVLIDFCAHLMMRGYLDDDSWAGTVDAFLTEYNAPQCSTCNDTGIKPGTTVIPPGHGSGFNSLDPDPQDRGSYVPCPDCHQPPRL